MNIPRDGEREDYLWDYGNPNIKKQGMNEHPP